MTQPTLYVGLALLVLVAAALLDQLADRIGEADHRDEGSLLRFRSRQPQVRDAVPAPGPAAPTLVPEPVAVVTLPGSEPAVAGGTGNATDEAAAAEPTVELTVVRDVVAPGGPDRGAVA